MIANVGAMPRFLRWLTLLSAGAVLIAARAALPGGVIAADGSPVSVSQWWLSGAGPGTFVAGALLGSSAVLMLRRSRHGRRLCVYGWAVATVSVAAIDVVAGITPTATLFHLLAGALFVLTIGLYLFKNKSVAAFFEALGAPGRPDRE